MTMQRLCQLRTLSALLGAACLCSGPAGSADTPVNNYPTVARVEFVQECIAKHGGKLENLYQCSCAIDRIANALSYDDFVEASTYAKYSALPGEGGGIFRDSDQARQMAKRYREVEADAYRGCGLGA
ncbi:MAG: hypothetical protein ACREXP_28490 [Steroidobacteraceae bacterium]